MQKIGILGAMKEEIAPLLEHYQHYQSIAYANNTFYQVNLANITLTIAYSRIGKVNSTLSASALIMHFGCEKIIFNGVAGGINPQLKIGDILLATQLCQHDADITAFGHPHGFFSEGQIFTPTNPKLNTLAKEAAKASGITLKEGIIATGDQFIHSKEKKDWIRQEFNADALEMEGASVALVCESLGIPLCVIRSISDNAEEVAQISFDEFLESSAKKSANLVIEMIQKLQ